jgi:transcriptional regulator with XRE-family HTH domain
MASPEALGSIIRLYRYESGLSQAALAGLLGVKRKAVGDWEYGRQPNRRNTKALETLLDRSLPVERTSGYFMSVHKGRPAYNRGEDLRGLRLGSLIVLVPLTRTYGTGKKILWVCERDCGHKVLSSRNNLKQAAFSRCSKCRRTICPYGHVKTRIPSGRIYCNVCARERHLRKNEKR